MVKQRTVSFKCRPMQVHPHAYVCTIYEQTKANSLKNLTWSEKTGPKGLLYSIQAREAMSVTVMGAQKRDIIH